MRRTKLPPLTESTGLRPVDTLAQKYMFSQEQVATIRTSVGNAASFMESKALHIKGLGFTRDQIVGVSVALGERVSDMKLWEGISDLLKVEGITTEEASLAYLAGVSPRQYEAMKPESKTLDALRTMASLRSI